MMSSQAFKFSFKSANKTQIKIPVSGPDTLPTSRFLFNTQWASTGCVSRVPGAIRGWWDRQRWRVKCVPTKADSGKEGKRVCVHTYMHVHLCMCVYVHICACTYIVCTCVFRMYTRVYIIPVCVIKKFLGAAQPRPLQCQGPIRGPRKEGTLWRQSLPGHTREEGVPRGD